MSWIQINFIKSDFAVQPCFQANGVITGFTIQWGPKPEDGKPFIPAESRHFDAFETQVSLKISRILKMSSSFKMAPIVLF